MDSASTTRVVECFQFPMDSACTPYNESTFAPEVLQLCQDECDLWKNNNGDEGNTFTTNRNKVHNSSITTTSSTTTATATNPFSLALATEATRNRLRVAKCIVVGDISVGKTCLINRFVNNIYSDNYKTTIGVDFEVQKFDILGRPFTLQIWDTAGQSRFRDITRIYYRGAHAVMLCFDLGNFSTFLNIKYWLQEVTATRNSVGGGSGAGDNSEDNDTNNSTIKSTSTSNNEQRPFIFLIGTKHDLVATSDEAEKNVQHEARRLAEQIGAEFWMVSSATGNNVGELFNRVACLTFNRYMRTMAIAAANELEEKRNANANSQTNTSGGGEVGRNACKERKKRLKSNDLNHANAAAELNGGVGRGGGGSKRSTTVDGDGTRPHSYISENSRAALTRMVHVPQELWSKFIAQLTEQMNALMRLKKNNKKRKSDKRTKRTNKVHSLSMTEEDGNVECNNYTHNNNNNNQKHSAESRSSSSSAAASKPRRKTFSCFNIKCTFSLE